METKRFSWFLGYLASDGSLVYPKYRGKGDESLISFCIHYKDREVLKKVQTILGTRAKIRCYPDYKSPQSQLCIYDRKDIMVRYHDIKSKVPDEIYQKHYIRGLIDGDGCLNYRVERNSFRINIINENLEIMETVSNIITNTLDINYKIPKYKKQDHLYILEWEGKVARFIAWWLYHGDIQDCVLERKFGKYKEYVLRNSIPENPADELFKAIGQNGQYLINRKNNGIVIHMQTGSDNSLIWSKRLSRIIKGSTPIPVSKGQIKFYALYIPIADTQSIQMDEDIVQ